MFKRKNRGYWAWINGVQTYLADDRRAAKTRERELRSGVPLAVTNDKSARALITDYLRWVAAYKAPTTYTTLAPAITSFSVFLPADLRAEAVTPAHVEDWLTTTRCRKPGSISRRITSLCSMFNWGVKTKRITANPIKGMPRPVPGVRETVLSADRYQELLQLVEKCRPMHDFLLFMLDTGARVEEMFKLRAEHIDLRKKVAVIPRSKAKGHHRANSVARVIYLPETAFNIASRLVKEHPHGNIFRNSRGSPYNKNSVNSYMGRLKKRMDMPGLCATVMRHSFAAHRIRSGQDLAAVGKLMGHVDPTMVYKIYGHLDDDSYLAEQAAAVGLPI